jgi:hypothetical protein
MRTVSATTARTPSAPTTVSHRTMHLLLAIQSLVVVLVSVNRLSSGTTGYVATNEFLRWVDLNNMILALVSLVAFYLLKVHLDGPAPRRDLGVAFIVGAYLLAASYGSHEVTNYLHVRFCPNGTVTDFCRVVVYNDDEFSHYLFFAGFTIINVVVMLTQVANPDPRPPSVGDNVLIAVNAVFIGAGIFANLAFEEIGLDLYVVAAIAVFSVALLWRFPKQPILRYYTVAYLIGLAATAVTKLL